MADQYSIPCFNSLIVVKESEDHGFDLCMKDASNPLSTGTLLSKYDTVEKAIRKADHFCSMYGLAREKGYHLKGNSLVKPEREDLPVSILLQADVSQDQLLSILDAPGMKAK